MNREEAIAVLKELSALCVCLVPYSVMLMPPNADDVLSKGYQLHIKANLPKEDAVCMRPHLEKRGLTLKQEEDLLVIYRPINL
jgi:hypothetical protein